MKATSSSFPAIFVGIGDRDDSCVAGLDLGEDHDVKFKLANSGLPKSLPDPISRTGAEADDAFPGICDPRGARDNGHLVGDLDHEHTDHSAGVAALRRRALC
jgi:hypothetical protein